MYKILEGLKIELREHMRAKIQGTAILEGFCFVLYTTFADVPWGFVWNKLWIELHLRALTTISLSVIGYFFALESYHHGSDPHHSDNDEQRVSIFYISGEFWYFLGWLMLFLTIVTQIFIESLRWGAAFGGGVIFSLIMHKITERERCDETEQCWKDFELSYYFLILIGLFAYCVLMPLIFVDPFNFALDIMPLAYFGFFLELTSYFQYRSPYRL